MKEKLKQHYLKFGPRPFVAATVLILAILDFVNSYYLKLYWTQKDISRQVVLQSILRSQMTIEDFSQDTMAELMGFVDNCFYFFLILILINNLFFYFFYLRKKLWAQGFVLFYTITAALFSVVFIFDGTNMGLGWTLYNIITIFIYLYLYAGVKLLKEETTILPQKKAQ